MRAWFTEKLLVFLLLWLGARAAIAGADTNDPADAAISRARAFLLARQSPDGAWRSHTYGLMKDGPSLTGHVAINLGEPVAADLAAAADRAAAEDRAAAYLASLAGGAKPLAAQDLIYPVYTAADAVRLLRARAYQTAHDLWRNFLIAQQLNQSLGWSAADPEYGGWSYALAAPRKPAPGQARGPWDWSNCSATRYALEALRADGMPASDPVCTQALVFLQRCQNADGGFIFSCADALHNKAGSAPNLTPSSDRFNSYGSATVDGYAALRLCGVARSDARVQSAARWLTDHGEVEHNPGNFDADHVDIRDATYFYYCRGLARFCVDAQQPMLAKRLAAALVARQRGDGSWSNPSTDAKEDDPLVATPLALAALVDCRRAMGADGQMNP